MICRAQSRAWLLPVLAGLAGSGCGSTEPGTASVSPDSSTAQSAPGNRPVAYQCGDLRLEVRFRDQDVEILLPDRILTLPAAVSASGARYADDRGNGFWSKGSGSAMFTQVGAVTVLCAITEARSPWVEARERGVHYRAVGQEPGWLVEVGQGNAPSIGVLLDYGARRLELRESEPLPAATGFRGISGTTPVELHIRQEICQDSMSGESFATAAELRVADTVYRGCGRFL